MRQTLHKMKQEHCYNAQKMYPCNEHNIVKVTKYLDTKGTKNLRNNFYQNCTRNQPVNQILS